MTPSNKGLIQIPQRNKKLHGQAKAKRMQHHQSSFIKLYDPMTLYSAWDCPGQNTGVGSLALLQAIFPTQASRIAGGFFTS